MNSVKPATQCHWARIVLAALLNLALAICVVPNLGHTADPTHSRSNLIEAFVEVLLACTALLTLAPVFWSGSAAPRLISIGLSFLPCYVVIAGFCDALHLWTSAR